MNGSQLSVLAHTSDLSTLLRSETLTKFKLGATCLLSTKTTEKQNHGQKGEPTIRRKQKCKGTRKRKKKMKRGRTKELSLMSKDLNLGHPTWFPLPGRAVKTIMPFTGGDQVVIFHALVGFWETRNEPNDKRLRLKVIPRICEQMALVHLNDVVPGEVQPHLLIESIYTT